MNKLHEVTFSDQKGEATCYIHAENPIEALRKFPAVGVIQELPDGSAYGETSYFSVVSQEKQRGVENE